MGPRLSARFQQEAFQWLLFLQHVARPGAPRKPFFKSILKHQIKYIKFFFLSIFKSFFLFFEAFQPGFASPRSEMMGCAQSPR